MDYDSSKDDDDESVREEGSIYEGDEVDQDDNESSEWKIVNSTPQGSSFGFTVR